MRLTLEHFSERSSLLQRAEFAEETLLSGQKDSFAWVDGNRRLKGLQGGSIVIDDRAARG
jgi:hypothetical protein